LKPSWKPGGFDYAKANLKKVGGDPAEGDHGQTNTTLNLKAS